MKRSVSLFLAMLMAITLSGCGWFGDKLDAQKNWTVEQFYQKAKEEMDSGNWQAAIKAYEALEAKYPFGRYAQQAQIDIAYCHYKEGDSAQAIAAVDRFAKLHPNHPNLDYALYLKGLVNFRVDLGFMSFIADQDLAERDAKAARDSFENFKELVQRFPESKYSEDARARMAYLVDALARGETKVADYYLRRGAPLAAANRAQSVILRYPQAKARDEALVILREAYKRMGITDLSDDVAKIIAKNNPQQAAAEQSKSWWKFWQR